MTGKVLIISSEYTGHGHKSIAQSLKEQYQLISPDTEVIVKNGFEFGGRLGDIWEKSYSPVTKYIRPVWNACYQITSKYCEITNKYVANNMEGSFIKYLKDEAPDLIVTVHAAFVGSIIDLMKKAGLNIPVAVIVADLVTFSRLWADSRADLTICPTEEASKLLQSWGVHEDKITVTGFPVRKKFYDKNPVASREVSAAKETSILLVNGAEKPETIIQIANDIVENVRATMTIITGRDEKLRAKLLKEYAQNPQISVLGYCQNIEEYMRSHDILISRGSPNVLMEAVNCHIPVVMFGALPGQEKENPIYMEKHQLGIRAEKIYEIPIKINQMLKNNEELLETIRNNQKRYSRNNAARNIVTALVELAEGAGDERAV